MSRGPQTVRTTQAGQAWDLLFAIALTGIGLLGWQSTFEGVGLWLAGGLATLVAAWVAQLAASFERGMFPVVVALLGVLYLISGPVAAGVDLLERPKETFWVGIEAAIDCWPQLLETHPPVAASGGVLMAPFLLCWASSGLAVGLGLCSTRPALPLLPPLAMFSAVLLLAQPEPVAAGIQGMAFGGAALMWLRIRSLRVEAVRHGLDPAWRARVAAGTSLVLVGAGLTWLLVGGSQEHQDRLVLRRLVTPYDVGQLTTPLSEFRNYTPSWRKRTGNVARSTLLRTEDVPRKARVRFAVLDSYDGEHWIGSNDRDPLRTDDRYLRISSTVENPGPGTRKRVIITPTDAWARHAGYRWLPTLGTVQALTFSDSPEAADELRFNPAANGAVVTGGLGADDEYQVTTLVDSDRLRPRMRPSTALDRELYRKAAFTDPFLEAYAPRDEPRMRQLFAVASRLREIGRYSDGAGPGQSQYTAGHDPRRLGKGFLLAQPTVGNDEQYAAAMALLANRLRIPARVVVGSRANRHGVIKGKHVEAWVEIRIEDGTWRRLPTDRFMGHIPPGEPPPGGQLQPRDFPDPPRSDPQQDQQDRDRSDPQERDSDDQGAVAWWRRPWPWLPLLVLLLPLIKLIRRHSRRSRGTTGRRMNGAWLELTDRARDLGSPVASGLTRPAQAAVLQVDPALAVAMDREIFSVAGPDPSAVDGYWQRLDAARRELTRSRPWWRRVWAWINPSSLRRR